MKTTIWVEFRHAGLHCWPGAPEHRAYLRTPHRHLFHVTVFTEVKHDDREIEFHDLLEQSKSIFEKSFDELPIQRSCETMARRLHGWLVSLHGRDFKVSVSEDGECGAIVE